MRGYVRRRGAGRWEIQVEVGRADGKRVRKSKTIVGDERDAWDTYHEMEVEATKNRKRGIVAKKELIVSHFIDKFVDGIRVRVKRGELASSRSRDVEGLVRLWVRPALGNMKIQDLRTKHVQDACDAWLRAERKDRKKGTIKVKTINASLALVKSIVDIAVADEVVVANVARQVKPLKDVPRPFEVPSLEEALRLVSCIGDAEPQLKAAVYTLLLTGLRRGELLALKRDDVDFENQTLRVRRAIERIVEPSSTPGTWRNSGDAKFELRIKEPKTPTSRRLIPLTDAALEVLRLHLVAQKADRLRHGSQYVDQGLLFCDERGGAVDPSDLSTRFQRAAKRAAKALKIPRASLHSLRHVHATALISQGADVKSTSALLGHSTVRTTLAIYSHVVDDAKQKAVSLLGDAYAEAERRVAARDLAKGRQQLLPAAGRRKRKSLAVQGFDIIAPTGVEPVSQP